MSILRVWDSCSYNCMKICFYILHVLLYILVHSLRVWNLLTCINFRLWWHLIKLKIRSYFERQFEETWQGNQRFYRQAIARRVQNHQTSFTTYVHRTSLGEKEKAWTRNKKITKWKSSLKEIHSKGRKLSTHYNLVKVKVKSLSRVQLFATHGL